MQTALKTFVVLSALISVSAFGIDLKPKSEGYRPYGPYGSKNDPGAYHPYGQKTYYPYGPYTKTASAPVKSKSVVSDEVEASYRKNNPATEVFDD